MPRKQSVGESRVDCSRITVLDRRRHVDQKTWGERLSKHAHWHLQAFASKALTPDFPTTRIFNVPCKQVVTSNSMSILGVGRQHRFRWEQQWQTPSFFFFNPAVAVWMLTITSSINSFIQKQWYIFILHTSIPEVSTVRNWGLLLE